MSKFDNYLETTIAVIASKIPGVDVIYTAYSTYTNAVAQQAIHTILKELSCRINKLDNKIDKKYFDSEDFKNLSYKTFVKAMTEKREDKLLIYAQFLAQSYLPDHTNNEDKYLFLETIDKINLEQLCFLNNLRSRNTLNDFENNEGWRGDEQELKSFNITEERFVFLSDYLTNLGLVSRIEKFEIVEGSLYMHREYYVSAYGTALLNYLGTFDAQ